MEIGNFQEYYHHKACPHHREQAFFVFIAVSKNDFVKFYTIRKVCKRDNKRANKA